MKPVDEILNLVLDHVAAARNSNLHKMDEAYREIRARLEGLVRDNRVLRVTLALQVSGTNLYGDDGELSDCSEHPFIDYKRDSLQEIGLKLRERSTRRASLGEQQAPQWRDIATAPRDSKARLVWVPENRCMFVVTWRDGDSFSEDEICRPAGWYIFGGHQNLLSGTPTHWMPLPPPPGEQQAPAEPLPDAVKTVIRAMQKDPDYAWSWHCNIAMAFVDAGGDRYTANQGAARFMKMLAAVDPAHALPAPPEPQAVPEPAWNEPNQEDLNDWFLSLSEGRRKALLDGDRWMLAGAAFLAGKAAHPQQSAAAPAAPEPVDFLTCPVNKVQYMDIYAQPGTRVQFHARGGYDSEKAEAMKHLSLGGVYTVCRTEVGRSSSTVWLQEESGRGFNTVLFGPAAAPVEPTIQHIPSDDTEGGAP
jgi:hypothetical protein